jgi:surface carbohydrate biosynthesis protein
VTTRVALVVDNPLRDLAGLTLLAARLAEHGAICHLVPMVAQEAELRALAPDVAVVNYLRPTNERVVRDLVDAEVGVVVLDTEGGVFADVAAYARTLTADSSLRSAVLAYCSWGRVLARHAVDDGWFRADQVEVTGAPRFDLYAPSLRPFALTANPVAMSVPTPIILFNGNFPVANPRYQSADQEATMLVERFGWSRSAVDEWQRTQRLSMEQLSTLAVTVARTHPAATVVYRPHPFENGQAYDRLLTGANNVRLVQEGTVDAWILRSSAVVQRSCTTAIEAALAGVPALSPTWIPTAVEMPYPEAVSVPCANLDEFERTIARALAGVDVVPDASRAALVDVVDAWFSAIDGRANERVAAVVLDRGTVHERRAHLRRCRAIGGRRGASWPRRLAKRYLPPEVRRLSPAPGTRARATSKLFTLDAIERLLSALREAGGPSAAAHRPDYATFLPFGRSVTVSGR